MNDMSAVIIPKSDQWNADDFIAGPMTFTIREVRITPGSEQPVNILLEGTDKFYRPCKSMSRVLVGAWGADAKAYVGRSLTLYRDPEVKWGGMAVGGIRISHMSDLDGAKTMVLTATKGSRKPFKVMPLVMDATPKQEEPAVRWANAYIANLPTLTDLAAVQAFADSKAAKLAELQGARPDLHEKVTAALEARKAQLAPATSGFDDDDFGTSLTPETPTQATQPPTLLDEVDQGAAQTPGENPAAARANAIIDEIKAAMAVMDVKAIQARNEVHIAAMDAGLAGTIEAVANARIAEIEASREKTAEAAE